jgi:hypothetical protein
MLGWWLVHTDLSSRKCCSGTESAYIGNLGDLAVGVLVSHAKNAQEIIYYGDCMLMSSFRFCMDDD